jgi:hypothetical protein
MSCEICYGSGCEHNCPCCNDYPEDEIDDAIKPDDWDEIDDGLGNVEYKKWKLWKQK